MCGIAGFLSINQKYSKNDLEGMTNKLSHRGPDASGYFYDKLVGLGHRRLSILDLSTAANQPMHSQCGRYTIVFNGEIYNFKELAKDLQLSLKTTSDTEVLLEAFVKLGPDFVSQLNGMFAFVIYDKSEKQLFIFRDRIGIKPIYYSQLNNDFIFASELKSLMSLGSLKKVEVDKAAINEFLYLGFIPAPKSIYKNIKKLPSGSYAIFKDGNLNIEKYWDVESEVLADDLVIRDYDQAKKKLKELLFSAVEKRMISDVPLGTFLSGGIDSSLVSAIAQNLSSRPISTFSIGFEEAAFNEAGYARKVADYLKTDHNEEILSYRKVLDLFEEMLDVYDEPFADSSAFPTLLVSEYARKQVSVILSGDGGDETHLGYGAYNWSERLDNTIVKLLRKPITQTLKLGSNRMKRASEVFNYSNSSRIKSHIFSQEQYLFSEKEIDQLLTDEYKKGLHFDEKNHVANRALKAEEQQSIFDLKYYLQDDLLVKVDRASMRHSLEVRVPLLDHRLIEFSINLDSDLRKKGNVSKYLLKEVLYDLVPKNLFERPKKGFSIPLIKWMRNEWRFLIEDYLCERAISTTGVFNYSTVNVLVNRFLNGETYLYNRLWLMIVIQAFLIRNRILVT